MSKKRNSGKGRPTPTQRKMRHRSRSLDERDYFYWMDRHEGLVSAMLWLLAHPADDARPERIAAMQTMTVNALVHLYGTDVPTNIVDRRTTERRWAAVQHPPIETTDELASPDLLSPAVLAQTHPPLDYLTDDGTVNPKSAFLSHLDQYLECSLLCLYARSQETWWASQMVALPGEAQKQMTFWRESAESWDPVEWASSDLEDYREEQALRLQRLLRERRNNPGRTRPGTRP